MIEVVTCYADLERAIADHDLVCNVPISSVALPSRSLLGVLRTIEPAKLPGSVAEVYHGIAEGEHDLILVVMRVRGRAPIGLARIGLGLLAPGSSEPFALYHHGREGNGA